MAAAKSLERWRDLDLAALAILLVAASFPATPPTVEDVLKGSGAWFWGMRLGPANAFEILLTALAGAWIVRSLVVRPTVSSFDRPLLGAGLILLGIQALTLPRHLGDAQFVLLDIERLLIPAAAYLVATRAIRDLRALRTFTFAIAAIICLRALELVFVYGLTGQTQFGTITGGEALLITEDSLLILLPLALCWGELVDGRLSLWAMVGATGLISTLLLIDVLSLRRGAMLLIGGALLARSLTIGRRRLLQAGVVLLVVGLLAVAAGPGRPLLQQLRYTAVSSTLRTKDASSGQRTAELTSLVDDMHGSDWVLGRGLGVTWHAIAKAPLDALSFGPGESEYTRIGWHVYGLDWLYKFGLLGIGVLLYALSLLVKRLLRAYREAGPAMGSLLFSLAVCAPPFVLLLFTNPRVAMMSGVTLGLLSRCCDLAGQSRTSPSGGEVTLDSSLTARST
jgi:hypothetical protein